MWSVSLHGSIIDRQGNTRSHRVLVTTININWNFLFWITSDTFIVLSLSWFIGASFSQRRSLPVLEVNVWKLSLLFCASSRSLLFLVVYIYIFSNIDFLYFCLHFIVSPKNLKHSTLARNVFLMNIVSYLSTLLRNLSAFFFWIFLKTWFFVFHSNTSL